MGDAINAGNEKRTVERDFLRRAADCSDIASGNNLEQWMQCSPAFAKSRWRGASSAATLAHPLQRFHVNDVLLGCTTTSMPT